jgi:hypothetical protein
MNLMPKTGARLPQAFTHLSDAGAGIVRFFRAGYPDGLPRHGFIAAAALLPSRMATGQEPGAAE